MSSKRSVICENLRLVRERIAIAARRADRSVDDIMLLPVTKTVGIEEINILYDAGLRCVGENRVMDALAKSEDVAREDLAWHLIGHLQRNKVRKALDLFTFLHSLDSLRLARALSAELVARKRSLPCLIEVNTSGEPQKHGFSPEEIPDAVPEIALLPGLRVEGLMTMAVFSDDPARVRPCFARLRELAHHLRGRRIPALRMKHLSMGMTQDFEIAVEEGATIVRVGSALFQGIEDA